MLLIMGAVLLAAGGIVLLAPRVPWLGHLPGDIHIRRGNISCMFPLATSLLLSLLLTILVNVAARLLRR